MARASTTRGSTTRRRGSSGRGSNGHGGSDGDGGANGHGAKGSPTSLRVRMYRVGFGDFLLVTVPSKTGPQHIVIDCGVTKGTTGKGDIASIKAAVRHMAAETDRKLALIIMTHRHQDHIVGFSRCADEFKQFTVDAVWMPYWETEYADNVSSFQAELEGLALDLRAAALAGAPDEDTAEILGIVENATGVAAEGPGGGSNAASLALLKHGLGVRPEYYFKGQKPRLPKGLTDAGLTAEILGPPPADDVAFLQLKDLKKGVAQYLGAAGDARTSAGKITPFGAEYVVSAEAYPTSAFREFAPRTPDVLPDFSQRYPAALEAAVASATPQGLLIAARKLDGMLNNQSLVVLFTWRDKKLLFAGDAQAGNWEYWLYDLDKPTSDPRAKQLAKDGKAILGSLDFYKVGHHGSTNATPITAVEAMNDGFVAMCSTQHDTFGSVANQSEVPRAPLIEALSRKATVVCSDQVAVTVDGTRIPAAKGARPLGKPAAGKLVVGECFIDYLL